MPRYGRKSAERPGKGMPKSLTGKKMIDPAGHLPYHLNIERISHAETL
jgi:hypothetical protein